MMPMDFTGASAAMNVANAGLNFAQGTYNFLGSATGLWDSTDVANAKKMSKQEYEYQLALMEKSNDYAYQQWQREIDWNRPINKLRLLKEAGLNPLFHDINGNNAGGLSSVSTPQAPNMGASWAAAVQSQRLQMEQMSKAAELANIEADTKKKEAETNNINANTEGQNISNAQQRIQLRYNEAQQKFDFDVQVPLRDEAGNIVYGADGNPVMVSNYDNKLQYAVHQMNNELDKASKYLENMSYDNAMKKIQSDHFEQEYMTRLEKLGFERDEAKLAIDLARAEIALRKAKTATEKAAAQELMTRAQLNIQNAAKAAAEAKESESRTDLNKAQKGLVEAQTTESGTRSDLNKAQTGESQARTATEGFKQSNYAAQTRATEAAAEGQEIQNEIESDLKTVTKVTQGASRILGAVGQGVGIATSFTPTGAIGKAMQSAPNKIGF